MKNLLLALSFALVAFIGREAKAQLPRLSLMYGDSKCLTHGFGVNNSLPDMGLDLFFEVLQFKESRIPVHSGPSVLWIGRNKINLPFKTSTGQTCNILAFPELLFTVNLTNGYGRMLLFKIPNHSALQGLRLYAQCAIPYKGKEFWSRGTELIIQK